MRNGHASRSERAEHDALANRLAQIGSSARGGYLVKLAARARCGFMYSVGMSPAR